MYDNAQGKSVVIVGSSPAGMQAAIMAAQQGHDIFLCEQEQRLGGSSNGRKQAQAVKRLVEEMKRHHVDVNVGLPITAENIMVRRPDIVIMAANGSLKSLMPTLREQGVQVIELEENGFNVAKLEE